MWRWIMLQEYGPKLNSADIQFKLANVKLRWDPLRSLEDEADQIFLLGVVKNFLLLCSRNIFCLKTIFNQREVG
jgi:hypothetical protein